MTRVQPIASANRRRVLLGGATALAATAVGLRGAAAQSFPSRPVTIVVPYPPGGSVDIMARALSEVMAVELGQPIVVENKGGASGSIGAAAVARAAPDGHTIVLGTQQTHATNPSVLKSLSYDPVKDFTPILGLSVIPHLLVTRKDLGASTVAALIAAAKAKPGGLIFGSTGVGSASHLAAEHFNQKAGIGTAVHLPFRGAAPMVQEILGGRVDYAVASMPGVVGQVQGGAMTALAVVRNRRLATLPALPALAEAGIADVDADAWFAMFGPAGISPDVTAKLAYAMTKALTDPGVRAKLEGQGIEVVVRPGAEVAAALPGEVARWAGIAAAAGVKPE